MFLAIFLSLVAAQGLPHSAFSENGHRQFDFWQGEWDVNLRMLQEDGSFRDSVSAVARIYSVLGGRAILELWDSKPIKGYSLRYYDPEAREWVLWLNWPSQNRSRSGTLSGSFRHGRGDFYAEQRNAAGETVLRRFSFNDITPVTLRWEDHASTDGGKTWAPNWIMEFTRRLAKPAWPIPRDAVPTFETGARCTLDGFRSYEALEGDWEGAFGDRPTTLSVYRVLDGCAVVLFVGTERFGFMTFDTTRNEVSLEWLTDDPRQGLVRFWGSDWTELEADGGDGESGGKTRFVLENDRLRFESWVSRRAEDSGDFVRIR